MEFVGELARPLHERCYVLGGRQRRWLGAIFALGPQELEAAPEASSVRADT